MSMYLIKEDASQTLIEVDSKTEVMKMLLCWEVIVVPSLRRGWYLIIDPNAKLSGKDRNEIASRVRGEEVYGDAVYTIIKNLKNI